MIRRRVTSRCLLIVIVILRFSISGAGRLMPRLSLLFYRSLFRFLLIFISNRWCRVLFLCQFELRYLFVVVLLSSLARNRFSILSLHVLEVLPLEHQPHVDHGLRSACGRVPSVCRVRWQRCVSPLGKCTR